MNFKSLHLSNTKRTGGDGGGVPKFAWYLQSVIGCDIFNEEDYGKADKSKYDVFIADGAYASRFPPGKLLISVVHGTWKEFAIRNDCVNAFQGEIDRQHQIWNRKDILKVAVSDTSAYYLKKHHDVEADAVIYNGIDTSVFVPEIHEERVRPLILHAANDYNKDSHGKLSEIAKLLPEFQFDHLEARIGEEPQKFARGDMFISCSNYEGNSYAILEALSCNLPVMASTAGIFEDGMDKGVGRVVSWQAPAPIWATAIRELWKEKDTFTPRQWAVENASFERFATQWNKFIGDRLK